MHLRKDDIIERIRPTMSASHEVGITEGRTEATEVTEVTLLTLLALDRTTRDNISDYPWQ